MAECHDTLQALAESAEKLILACAAHVRRPLPLTPPSPRADGVSRALRKTYRTSPVIPAGMLGQVRTIR